MTHDQPADTPDLDRRALRLLAAAGDPAELAGDLALAARYRRLESAWSGLELPPAAPVPIGFSGRVMAHVRELPRPRPDRAFGGGGFGWAAMPRWVRTTGAAAMVVGLLLGTGLGIRPTAEERSGQPGEPALAECYWSLVGAATSADEGAAAATPGGAESGASAAMGGTPTTGASAATEGTPTTDGSTATGTSAATAGTPATGGAPATGDTPTAGAAAPSAGSGSAAAEGSRP